jgi:predicted nicotinamide N-methyase
MALRRREGQGKRRLCGAREGGYRFAMTMSRPLAAAEEPARLDAAAFIRARLPLLPVPGVPEVRLHRATPSSGLRRLAELDAEGFGAPYWAYCWAGGLALARHILERPETVAGRRVLDLGAGSGLVAIVAAKAGAGAVSASESDPYAVAALRLNAAANGVALAAVLGDLTDGPPPDVDLVMVGDLFYEAELAERVAAFLERCAQAGIDALVGDPWRAFLPRARLNLIAEYRVADFGDGSAGATTASAVFAFRRSAGPLENAAPPA